MKLTDQQFESICCAVMEYGFLSHFGQLTLTDERDRPELSAEDQKEFEDEIFMILKKEAHRRQLTEVADYLHYHWADNDSPKGEYASSSSPLLAA